MAIVRTDVPMTPELCEQTLQTLAQTYPFLRLRALGQTFYGRTLWAAEIGEGERKVLYSAAHHANEWITTPVLLKFLEQLCRSVVSEGTLFGVPAATIVKAATLHVVPMVNPDGVALVTGELSGDSPARKKAEDLSRNYPDIPFPEGWKANLLGVDLNLQYPAGWLQAREIKFGQGYTRPGPRDYVGRAPLSQQESRILAWYTEDVDPDMVLAYHTQGEVIYWQFEDYQTPEARIYGEEFARLSGYALEDTPYESSFAGYKDWFLKFFRRPGYTIEVGLGENPLPLVQFDKIYRDNLGILVTAATGLPE